MTIGGETCFDLQKPVVGKAPGRVCLTPFGEIRVEHRLLQAPVMFSTGRVRALMEPGSLVEGDLPALSRDPVALHLPRDGFTPPNVAFLFSAPVRVGPFRLGARQVLPLSRSQRRDGVDVDLLALTIEEPELLVQGLGALGVRSSSDLGRSLEGVISRVPPGLEAEVLEGRRRRARRTAWKLVTVGVLMAALLGAGAHSESSWESIGRGALASAAASILAGLALSISPHGSRRHSAVRRWGGWGVAGLTGLVALAAAVGASARLSGGAYLLMWALLVGPVSGVVVAQGLRGLSATRTAPESGDPLARPPRRRIVTAMPVAVLAVAMMAVTVASEESAARIVRDIQAALVDEEDVPGWTECCNSDEILRGDDLDQHICGGDDGALPAHRAAVRRSFNKVSPGHPDLADAHFDVTLLVAPTVADAKQEFAAIDSPTYVSCTAISIGQRASQFQSGATDLAEAVYEGRERVAGLSDVIVDRFRVRVPVSGTFDAMTGFFVRARVGRTIVRMPILVYVPQELDEPERDTIVRAVIEEVEAADL